MRKLSILFITLFALTAPSIAQSWQQHVAQSLPLLGHRNWILVVDSAYPEQVGAGIETIETNEDQVAVLREVLSQVQNSIHVRSDVLLDAELPYIPDSEAPGVSNYRSQLQSLLSGYTVHHQLHQSLIDQVAKDSAQFHVLILKTRGTIPYTSVFIHLNCRYWSDESERGLREAMSGGHPPAEHPR